MGPSARSRRPRDYNQLVDLDRLRILSRLRDGNMKMAELKHYVEKANGLRHGTWNFYYVLRSMEDDALLIAKVDPNQGETIVKITEYGNQRFERTMTQLEEIRTLLKR